jgi:hypothetical protein
VDLAPGNEVACWLTAEALRAQFGHKGIRILICPVAAWLLDEHLQQVTRLGASIWSGTFELQELLQLVAAAVYTGLP